MKQVNDWKLDKKAKRVVKKELEKWVATFTKHADGKTANPRKTDYEHDDVLFYTDCKDIISGDSDASMSKRKSNAGRALLVNKILGNITDKKITCTHCGSEHYHYEGTSWGTLEFCDDCQRVIIDFYLPRFPYGVFDAYDMIHDWVLKSESE